MATEAIYRLLNRGKKEIRVLRLKASETLDAILDCNLEIVSLLSDPKPEYEAISYCWGEVDGHETIRLNDVPFDAPGSAAKALRQFCHREGSTHDRCLWIDAVCINQIDLAERSSQVSIMGDVYSSCVRCLVWLGDADDDTASAIHCANEISNQHYGDLATAATAFPATIIKNELLSESYLRASKTLNIEHLTDFFKKPWFTRVWVVQEVTLAPSATCQCGSLYIEWRDVRRAGAWTLYVTPGSKQLLSLLGMASIPGLLITSTVDKMGRAWTWKKTTVGLQDLIVARSSGSGSKRVDLHELMACSAYLNVSDPRDHFYALLGLVQWNPDKDEYMRWLRVDYTLSDSAVARDTARALIIQTETLRALETADGEYHSSQSSLASAGNYSSWQWCPKTDKSLSILDLRVAQCADRPLDLALVRDSAQHKCILLRGYQICDISRLFPRNVLSDATNFHHGLAQQVAETMRELDGEGAESTKLWRPLLETLTQGTVDLRVSGLDDEECLRWLYDFVEYVERRHETPSDSQSQPPSNSVQFTQRDDDSIIWLCRFRRFFLTTCGRIGLGPEMMGMGDCVAALFGGYHPCNLRPCSPPEDERPHLDLELVPQCYRFVGLAYIHGVMNGEAVEEKDEAGEAPAIFEIW